MVFGQGRRRRRRRLKTEVYIIILVVVLVFYRLNEIQYLTTNAIPNVPPQQVLLKDSQGNVVSKSRSSLLEFLQDVPERADAYDYETTISLEQAQHGREPILQILKDAGITEMEPRDIMQLPTWAQVEDLYGTTMNKGPVIVGLEQCQEFSKRVPLLSHRFVGVAGMFNSGTTAFGISLQANCQFPNHPKNVSNNLVVDVNGMLNQVPWGKHKIAHDKDAHTLFDQIEKSNVLPVVLIRDPYYWMQSMCKQGYGARWDHTPNRHCPNLVPNDYDRRRFKLLRNASSVQVWMGMSRKQGPSWDSLIHYWNDWYAAYYRKADVPRLLIRFEDTLFHSQEVMRQVCHCAGGRLSPHHRYLVDEAKWDHKQTAGSQNNLVSAILRYGTDARRYHNLTMEDLHYASTHLDPELMELFHYKSYKK